MSKYGVCCRQLFPVLPYANIFGLFELLDTPTQYGCVRFKTLLSLNISPEDFAEDTTSTIQTLDLTFEHFNLSLRPYAVEKVSSEKSGKYKTYRSLLCFWSILI